MPVPNHYKPQTRAPAPGIRARRVGSDGRIDLTAFANYMGQPITREASANAWALGESVNARRDAMQAVTAPDFELPDLDGKLHKLSDYRGKKVFLYSWGSY